ncbi:prenyltransferase [Allonocardiopsis opalescens]|uniref:Prenyltransferase/squalene oxidase-like repeat protein n=1 Tax=Allonocardiopsis opalescens TaxID=1144618 RepID=A0A2T0QDS3_9ACTN|nr:prenyltransferase [Allonocardiopsis opalescens]PRY02087.1 hypothetical protein CLV72_101687 [Allonocardiopsis opalescens]
MPLPEVPEVPGALSAGQLLTTARYLLAVQEPSGAIPWFPGGRLDPWDHVECAMALTVAGHRAEAVRAYEWLAAMQRPDGSWPAAYRRGGSDRVSDPTREANQTAYLATGVWHHLLVTGDTGAATRLWPAVRRALEFVLALQAPRGEVRWARGPDGSPAPFALLTGCSSVYHALRCGVALGERLDDPQPGWELAADRLGHLVAEHEDVFADRSRYSMDWYYPVLGGAVRGAAARERFHRRWSEFVVRGLGARCVSDQPWVTAAESSELVLALDAAGLRGPALRLFRDIQHLRDETGAYWTGYQFANDVRWPVERTTWTSAAVILAADALSGATPGSALFRAPTDRPLERPAAPDPAACGCGVRVA